MQYVISKRTAPDWGNIPAVELTHTGWLKPCDISAKAQLCHNGETLFVRMEAREARIRAELSQPVSQVCDDSCLEFFFAPCAEDPRYFNFEWNPLGNSYIGFGMDRYSSVRQLPVNMQQFAAQPFKTPEGWGITYEIPGSFLRMYLPEFHFTGKAACNFYKCGDQTEIPHYLSWNPMTCPNPDYHRRQDFGTLIFE